MIRRFLEFNILWSSLDAVLLLSAHLAGLACNLLASGDNVESVPLTAASAGMLVPWALYAHGHHEMQLFTSMMQAHSVRRGSKEVMGTQEAAGSGHEAARLGQVTHTVHSHTVKPGHAKSDRQVLCCTFFYRAMQLRVLVGCSLVCAFALLHSDAAGASDTRKGVVIFKDGRYQFSVDDTRDDAIAVGSFQASHGTKSGWAQLYIESNGAFTDEEQMQAAGYLEGYLTAYEISAHHQNMESFFDIKTDAPAQWLLQQDTWSRGQVASNKSAFWSTLGLLLDQHSGMMEGYWAAAKQSHHADGKHLPHLSLEDFLKLSAVGGEPYYRSLLCIATLVFSARTMAVGTKLCTGIHSGY